MAQPVWVTPAGDLGTIAENLFFQVPVLATDPDGGTPTYSLIAGRVPEGIQVTSNGTIEGVPLAYTSVKGTPTEVSENVTSTFAIRATSPDGASINDRTFSLTVTGQDIPEFTTAAGSLGTFYDCDGVNITIGFTDTDPNDVIVIDVDNGELPPGLTINPTTGVISGHITPISDLPDDATAGYDASAFDLYPFSFQTRSINKNYEFTLRITDGKDQNLRTFTMFVVSRDSLTADTTDFDASNDVLTADLSPQRTPYITNYPPATTNPTVVAGTIGTFRHDNFFAYQLIGFDCDGDRFEFEIIQGDSADLPPGIVFDRSTGWLTGFFPDQGATETIYNFDITIAKLDNNQVVSAPYSYTISVIGNIENSVVWLDGTLIPGRSIDDPIYSLGSINNGGISTFSIEATNPTGRLLLFKLGTYSLGNQLPQGLSLLESGNIAGRVSFNTFAIDSGTTTFDKDVSTRLNAAETTFDKAFDFTVVAYSSDGLVSVSRRFRITVDRAYNSPYQGLYIKAMPDQKDRNLVNSLLQDTDIIQPSRMYRPDDPYFGIASSVIYNHAYSLDTANLDEYLTALSKNHFRKKLILGKIKTAQALNTDGTVEYEVVYSEVVDTGVNKLGESPPQSITLPYPVTVQGASAVQVKVEFQEPQVIDNDFYTLEAGGIHALADRTYLSEFPPYTTPKISLVKKSEDVTWHRAAKNLSLLTTVASQMASNWQGLGNQSDPTSDLASQPFNWTPQNECTVWNTDPETIEQYNKFFPDPENYDNADIIWSEYKFGRYKGSTVDPATGEETTDIPKPNPENYQPGDDKYHVAPYALITEPAGEDYVYIAVRGTLNGPDGGLDVQFTPEQNPFGNFKGLTVTGFTKAFRGLGFKAGNDTVNGRPNIERGYTIPGQTLFNALTNTTRTKIRIGGHSLGGAVATLVTALAADMNKFSHIESIPSAGPQAGNSGFYTWFKTLRTTDGKSVNDHFDRIVNRNENGEWNDVIPKFPDVLGTVHVGKSVYFNARYLGEEKKYGDVAKNHQICGAYAYAIRFPDTPFNDVNDRGEVIFPKPVEHPIPPREAFSLKSHLMKKDAMYNANYKNSRWNIEQTEQTVTTVYPNSLINMRDRVIDTVGQESTVLPQWMTTKQTDGRVLGFTKAWVICYTNPGESDRISYNIRTRFGEILNRVNFVSDRYILDNQLTTHWSVNDAGGTWIPSPPLSTTFNTNQTTNPTSSGNPTIFDANATQFTSPVDIYGKTDKYDKYLVFPTNNILGSGDSATTTTHVSGGNVTIDQSLEDYYGPYYVFGTSDSGFTLGTKGYFYPLYTVRSEADEADTGTGSATLGNGTSHVHTFEDFPNIKFYMPNSSMNHGKAIKPENVPVYRYTGNLGPMATVVADTTPPAYNPNTPSTPSTPSYGGGGSSGGGGGGYGSSSSSSGSSSASYSGY